jgi:hypothetical protein
MSKKSFRMNASNASRVATAALVLFLAAVFAVPVAVVAQQSVPLPEEPRKLAPPQALQPSKRDKPAMLEPKPDAATGVTVPRSVDWLLRPKASPVQPEAAVKSSSTSPSVQIDSLRILNSDSVGTMTAAEGGFGVAMWRGTNRALVDALLPRLPIDSSSLVVRDLMRRLLLSSATAPDGESKPGSLVALRARLLAAMGDGAGVDALLKSTPGRGDAEGLMRIEADTRFLANDNARACVLAANQISRHPTPYWQKAFIFCQAMAGEQDKASLGVELLRETDDEDAAFFTFIDAINGGGAAVVDSLARPSPLHLTMARAAKARLPADIISTDHPGVLRTVAISPNASVELRLEAAERAEAVGALAVDTLRQIYTGITFSNETLANPLSRAEAESGPLSRALLYRTALIQTVPTAQAEAAHRALSLAREGGRYASTARIFLPVLRGIKPSAELMWFAPEAVRALLAAGDLETVKTWLGFLRANALFNEDSRQLLTEVGPLVHLAGANDGEPWSDDHLRRWAAGLADNESSRRHAALLYTLIEALDGSVPEDLWANLLEGPQRVTIAMPRPALWQRLHAATDAGRVGETILLALIALGDGGAAEAHPIILRRVLFSLRNVGLEAEARAMAVEALLAVGL